jgi:two-component system sensor histidine kinase UhpB
MSRKSIATPPEEDSYELYENAPCGYVSTLADGRIVRANLTFLAQIGAPRNEIVGQKTIQELMTLPGRIFFETHFAPMIRMQGKVNEIACDFVRAVGPPMPALVNAVSVGDADGFIRFTIFDATERRRYEAELIRARNRAEHYAVIVNASPDAIFSLDASGKILTWNHGAERVFGYDHDEVVGTSVWDLAILPDTDRGDELVSELASGQPVQRLFDQSLRDGRTVALFATFAPHIEPPSELTAISAIIRDVTERRQANEDAQRRSLLENILKSQESERSRIARDLHDHVGQQITGLRLSLRDLANADPKNEGLAERAEKLERQALSIDRDLSFLAYELRPSILNEIGLADALAAFLEEWSGNYGIAGEFHARNVPTVRLAPDLETNLYRIVQEALNNALKHSRATKVEVLLDFRDADAVLIVEDDGVGFARDPHLSTAQPSNHGLGLLGMQERAALLGGTLAIESNLNEGTTLIVRVPVQFAH